MKKLIFFFLFFIIFIFLGIYVSSIFFGSTTPLIDQKYCKNKGDCYASGTLCECVGKELYDIAFNLSINETCENFGCDCIDYSCTKVAPRMK